MSEDLITTLPDIDRKIRGLADALHDEYADPVYNHFASPHVAAAVDGLRRQPHMEGDEEVSIIPSSELEQYQSLEATLELAKKYANEKAQGAIERSEFSGLEVEEAIRGYYQDHTVALALLRKVVKGTQDDSKDIYELSDDKLGLQSVVLSEAIKTLAAMRVSGITNERFNDLVRSTSSVLFSEPSVGQLSLDDETIDEVSSEIFEIREAAVQYGARNPGKKEDIRSWIETSAEKSRQEVRPAGQLLFHNTAFGADVIEGDDNYLRSQAQQHRAVQSGRQSQVRVTTGSYEETRGSHGGNIHWSETYDPITYKRLNGSVSAQNKDIKAGMMTYAVPLGEVISRAPFGRGLKYAVVQGRPDTIAVKPSSSPVGNIGSGSPEYMGGGFGAVDRVFWSSDTSFDDATTYEIPVGGADILRTNPITNQPESSVYVIQSQSDQLANYQHWRNTLETGTPDFDELQRLARTMTESELVAHYGGVSSEGLDLPTIVTISDLEFDTSRSALEAKNAGTGIANKQEFGTWSREAGHARQVISKLEDESMARYEGQFVVPLRASRPDFMNRGDNMVSNPYGETVLADIRRAYL